MVLIGATTENPYFEVNAPLLSRSRLFRLERLSDDASAICWSGRWPTRSAGWAA